MRITAAEIIPIRVHMDVPYGEIESIRAVVACLQTDQGLEGLGHASAE